MPIRNTNIPQKTNSFSKLFTEYFKVEKFQFSKKFTFRFEYRNRANSFNKFQAAHYGYFDQKSFENTVFLDKELSKMTIVCPKCASWRSNQEWHSIGADTVNNMKQTSFFK